MGTASDRDSELSRGDEAYADQKNLPAIECSSGRCALGRIRLDARSVSVLGDRSGTETGSPKPAAAVQVPKMKFFDTEISRMVLGVNPFCGYAHYNNNFSGAMKDWYTPERVCAVMRDCTRYGINAFNYVALERLPQDWLRFVAEGGKMHLIM